MLTVAKLSTIATLNSQGFTAGIGKMTTSIGALSQISAGAFQRIGHIITDTAVRIGTALVHAAAEGLEMGEALKHSATMTGIAVEELQNFHRVAALANVSAEDFDLGVTRMNKALAEAAIDGGEAAKTIKAIGLSVEDLRGMAPGDAFLEIADAIERLGSVGDKTRVISALFGRDAGRMLKLLSQGAGGFTSQRKTTAGLGLNLSSGEVEGVSSASDAMRDVGQMWAGFKLQLAKGVGPELRIMAEDFRTWVVDTKAIFTIAESVVNAFKTSLMAGDEIFRRFRLIRASFESGNIEQETENLTEILRAKERKQGRGTKKSGWFGLKDEPMTPAEKIQLQKEINDLRFKLKQLVKRRDANKKVIQGSDAESVFESLMGGINDPPSTPEFSGSGKLPDVSTGGRSGAYSSSDGGGTVFGRPSNQLINMLREIRDNTAPLKRPDQGKPRMNR